MLHRLTFLWCTALLALASDLPDRRITPGSAARVPIEVLCVKGYTKSVRHVSGSTKAAVYRHYGIKSHRSGEYEIDHLISLELGGSNDINNLWPQSYAGTWNAHVKDQLEDRLHAMVCAGQISSGEAQKMTAVDWIEAYKRIFHTDEPITTTTRRRR
jgi:hypothetical protein